MLIFRLGIFLGCVLLTSACATAASPLLPRTQLSPEAEQTFYYLVLEQAVRNNDMEAAQTAVERLASLDPQEEFFRDGGALFLFGENPEGARALAEQGLGFFPDDADLTIVLAESYLMERRDAEAVGLLQQYLARHPRDITIRNRLGEILIQLQRFAEAEHVLRQIPAAKRNAYTQMLLAKIQIGLGHPADAERMLKEIIRQNPSFLEAWSELAFLLENRKDFSNALKIYEMLLPQDSENAALWGRIVALTLKMNDPARALNITRQGPPTTAFRLNAATSFMDEGFPAEAETLLSDLQSTQNASDEGWYYLALAMVENRNAYAEALRLLDNITPDSPFYQRMLLLRAQLFAESGSLDEAISAVQSLREEYPDVPELWKLEAQFLGRAQQDEAALSLLNEAVRKWPDDMDLRFILGVELDRQNKKGDAMNVMEYIVAHSPDNPHALNYVGYTLAEQNRSLDRALKLIQRALSLYPESYHIIDSLAWVYYHQKNYPAAWSAIRKAISLNGQEGTLWEHYGDIARALGKKNEAREGYAKALELGVDNPDDVVLRLQQVQ